MTVVREVSRPTATQTENEQSAAAEFLGIDKANFSPELNQFKPSQEQLEFAFSYLIRNPQVIPPNLLMSLAQHYIAELNNRAPTSRISEISKYIEDNPTEFVFANSMIELFGIIYKKRWVPDKHISEVVAEVKDAELLRRNKGFLQRIYEAAFNKESSYGKIASKVEELYSLKLTLVQDTDNVKAMLESQKREMQLERENFDRKKQTDLQKFHKEIAMVSAKIAQEYAAHQKKISEEYTEHRQRIDSESAEHRQRINREREAFESEMNEARKRFYDEEQFRLDTLAALDEEIRIKQAQSNKLDEGVHGFGLTPEQKRYKYKKQIEIDRIARIQKTDFTVDWDKFEKNFPKFLNSVFTVLTEVERREPKVLDDICYYFIQAYSGNSVIVGLLSPLLDKKCSAQQLYKVRLERFNKFKEFYRMGREKYGSFHYYEHQIWNYDSEYIAAHQRDHSTCNRLLEETFADFD